MPPKALSELSRRERQIMDILFQQSECTAQDVRDALPSAPSYSAVRALLARLVEHDLIAHRQEGKRYLYRPLIAQDQAQNSALKRLLKTFFKGSKTRAFSALLDMEGETLSARELAELERKIEQLKAAKPDIKDDEH
jgi:BlaI family penicillinase repressor